MMRPYQPGAFRGRPPNNGNYRGGGGRGRGHNPNFRPRAPNRGGRGGGNNFRQRGNNWNGYRQQVPIVAQNPNQRNQNQRNPIVTQNQNQGNPVAVQHQTQKTTVITKPRIHSEKSFLRDRPESALPVVFTDSQKILMLDNIIFISSFQEFASWLSPDVKFIVGKVYPFAVSPKHLGFIIVTKEKKNDQTKFEDVKLGLYNLREAIYQESQQPHMTIDAKDLDDIPIEKFSVALTESFYNFPRKVYYDIYITPNQFTAAVSEYLKNPEPEATSAMEPPDRSKSILKLPAVKLKSPDPKSTSLKRKTPEDESVKLAKKLPPHTQKLFDKLDPAVQSSFVSGTLDFVTYSAMHAFLRGRYKQTHEKPQEPENRQPENKESKNQTSKSAESDRFNYWNTEGKEVPR